MRQRSIDMLQTLRKSTKKYSGDDFSALIEDLRAVSTAEVLETLFAATATTKARKSVAADVP